MSRMKQLAACVVTVCLTTAGLRAGDAALPRVAVFPLAGDAPVEQREKAAFGLRAKLDRTQAFEVVDGYAMTDLVSGLTTPVDVKTNVAQLKSLAPDAAVILWGSLDKQGGGSVLRLNLFDRRGGENAEPRVFDEAIPNTQDLRFVAEKILASLKDVKPFEHMTEDAITDDDAARRAWDDPANRNLVVNPDFNSAPAAAKSYKHEIRLAATTAPTTRPERVLLDEMGAYDPVQSPTGWHWVLGPKTTPVRFFDALPDTDQVVIYRAPARGGAESNPYLIMNLSRNTAENNGLVARSAFLPIKPNVRYRLAFRYRSDGPTQRVFVKGFTLTPDISGEKTEREIYRRQVPPSGATDGQWKDVTVDLNPQHNTFPVKLLRIDLYAYLSPGQIAFDDVVLKEVGAQTRVAKDDAIDLPVERKRK